MFTLGDVAAALEDRYESSARPTLTVVEDALDFKEFLAPYLNHDIHNHTGMMRHAKTGGPRAFRFAKLADGNVGMWYREYAGVPAAEDQEWLGVELMRFHGHPLSRLPTEPWRVFTKLPPLVSIIPNCAAPVVLQHDLKDNIIKLDEWLAKTDSKDPIRPPPDTLHETVVKWFRRVNATKTLCAEPALASSKPDDGVGVARSLTASFPVRVPAEPGDAGKHKPPRFVERHIPIRYIPAEPAVLTDICQRIAAQGNAPAEEKKLPTPPKPPTIVYVKSLRESLRPSSPYSDDSSGEDEPLHSGPPIASSAESETSADSAVKMHVQSSRKAGKKRARSDLGGSVAWRDGCDSASRPQSNHLLQQANRRELTLTRQLMWFRLR